MCLDGRCLLAARLVYTSCGSRANPGPRLGGSRAVGLYVLWLTRRARGLSWVNLSRSRLVMSSAALDSRKRHELLGPTRLTILSTQPTRWTSLPFLLRSLALPDPDTRSAFVFATSQPKVPLPCLVHTVVQYRRRPSHLIKNHHHRTPSPWTLASVRHNPRGRAVHIQEDSFSIQHQRARAQTRHR